MGGKRDHGTAGRLPYSQVIFGQYLGFITKVPLYALQDHKGRSIYREDLLGLDLNHGGEVYVHRNRLQVSNYTLNDIFYVQEQSLT